MNTKCAHVQQTKHGNLMNCVLCGTLMTGSCCVLKDDSFNARADVSPALLYSNMLADQNVSRYYNSNASYIPVLHSIRHLFLDTQILS